MLSVFSISGLLILTTSALMAVFMFIQNKLLIHILWGIFCISVAFWGLGAFRIGAVADPGQALWWWRIAYIGVIFIPVLFTHFVYIFLKISRRWLIYLLYAIGAFYLAANLLTDFFIRDVHYMFDEFYYLSPTPLYTSFVVLTFLGLVIYSHVLLFQAYRKEKGEEKRRIQYFFLATFIGYLGGSFSFLPVYNIEIYPALNLTVALYPIIMGYAIVRHRLMDIKIVLTQLFVLALWAFILIRTLIAPLGSQDQIINGGLLLTTIVVGILLVRSVMKEVRQREAIGDLNVKLKQANEQLESLLDIKNEFLQIASHQLRTPVSVMRGMLDMMREGKGSLTPEQQSDMIERAYIKSEKLNQVIDDVLSATEMDVPNFDISGTARSVDLVELARRAVDSHRDEAADKGLTLTLEVAENVPKVKASETYLPQAMTNLIDNAIKYTKEGSVTVRVYPEDDQVVLAVEDTGIGVPEKDLPHLWSKFKRAANAKDMHTDGSGLGLFIIKKIVEGHPGGTVFAKSKLNQGSTFGFKLPMMKEAEKA